MNAIRFTPVSEALGAEAEGIDLARVIDSGDREALDAIRAALDAHLVLRFRGQRLDPFQIEALGRHFGPLLSLKRPENKSAAHIEGIDYLKVITNKLGEDGRPAGDGSAAEQDWHSDGAMKPIPATYSYFYARKVPADPPRTWWMNMYKVYADLPRGMKEAIAPLQVIHHHYSAGNEYPLPPSLPLEERLKGPRHPLARVHPATGRPILYLPHRSDALVVGMDENESARLIAWLRGFACASVHRWGTAMQVDDFVIWDNRPCLHRRDGWDPREERVMWHLANQGEPPVPFAA